MTQRQLTQEVVEADVVASVVQRRTTQIVVEADVVSVADTGVGIGPVPLPTTPLTIYDVSVGKYLEMKHLLIDNTSSSPVVVYVSIGADASNTRWLSGYSIPANDSYEWEGYEVIPALGKIQAFASVVNVCNLYLDGVLQT